MEEMISLFMEKIIFKTFDVCGIFDVRELYFLFFQMQLIVVQNCVMYIQICKTKNWY